MTVTVNVPMFVSVTVPDIVVRNVAAARDRMTGGHEFSQTEQREFFRTWMEIALTRACLNIDRAECQLELYQEGLL